MKLMTTLAAIALLWGGAAKANDFATSIEQAYAAAGYTNIVVAQKHGDWLVTADLSGVTKTFLVNASTGTSTAVDPTLPVAGTDGVAHDAGDDLGNDTGVDGVAEAAGDDNGVDGAAADVGDDNGTDAADDTGDDTGGGEGSDNGGSDD